MKRDETMIKPCRTEDRITICYNGSLESLVRTWIQVIFESEIMIYPSGAP